jgi:hypothetical protein
MLQFKRLFIMLWALASISGCALVPDSKPATDASLSYRFTGFSLSPPTGANWFRRETDASKAVFYKALQKREFFQLAAVVSPFETHHDRQANESFADFIEQVLLEKYQATGKLALLKLTLSPLTLHKANCVAFETQQGEKFFPPIREPRIEFIHQGYVCQHPNAALLIQGIVTEHRLHDADLTLEQQPLQEAYTLIRSIQFTTPVFN